MSNGIQSEALAVATALMQQATAAAAGWEQEVDAVEKSAKMDIESITKQLDAGDRAHQLMVGKLNAAHSAARKSFIEQIEKRHDQLRKDMITLEARNKPITVETVLQSAPVRATDKYATKALTGFGRTVGYFKNRIQVGLNA